MCFTFVLQSPSNRGIPVLLYKQTYIQTRAICLHSQSVCVCGDEGTSWNLRMQSLFFTRWDPGSSWEVCCTAHCVLWYIVIVCYMLELTGDGKTKENNAHLQRRCCHAHPHTLLPCTTTHHAAMHIHIPAITLQTHHRMHPLPGKLTLLAEGVDVGLWDTHFPPTRPPRWPCVR